jgi:hypothetical protein
MKELTFDTRTVGGICYALAIPSRAVAAIAKNDISGLHSVAFISMDEVIKLDSLDDETFMFQETHGRDEHGDYWEVSVQAVVPKACIENAVTIEQLERGEWIVISKDQNGVLRVSGDKDTLLACSSDTTSGMAYSDANHTVLTFTGKLGHPSWLITNNL